MGKLGGKFHDEVAVDAFRVKLLHKVAGCFHGGPCSQEVVVKEDDVIGRDRVFVDFYRVDAIFFGVTLLDGITGELSRFAAKYDAGTETDSGCGAHDEATALDTNDLCNAFILIQVVHHVADDLHALTVLEEGSNVPEVKSLNRPIWDRADIG